MHSMYGRIVRCNLYAYRRYACVLRGFTSTNSGTGNMVLFGDRQDRGERGEKEMRGNRGRDRPDRERSSKGDSMREGDRRGNRTGEGFERIVQVKDNKALHREVYKSLSSAKPEDLFEKCRGAVQELYRHTSTFNTPYHISTICLFARYSQEVDTTRLHDMIYDDVSRLSSYILSSLPKDVAQVRGGLERTHAYMSVLLLYGHSHMYVKCMVHIMKYIECAHALMREKEAGMDQFVDANTLCMVQIHHMMSYECDVIYSDEAINTLDSDVSSFYDGISSYTTYMNDLLDSVGDPSMNNGLASESNHDERIFRFDSLLDFLYIDHNHRNGLSHGPGVSRDRSVSSYSSMFKKLRNQRLIDSKRISKEIVRSYTHDGSYRYSTHEIDDMMNLFCALPRYLSKDGYLSRQICLNISNMVCNNTIDYREICERHRWITGIVECVTSMNILRIYDTNLVSYMRRLLETLHTDLLQETSTPSPETGRLGRLTLVMATVCGMDRLASLDYQTVPKTLSYIDSLLEEALPTDLTSFIDPHLSIQFMMVCITRLNEEERRRLKRPLSFVLWLVSRSYHSSLSVHVYYDMLTSLKKSVVTGDREMSGYVKMVYDRCYDEHIVRERYVWDRQSVDRSRVYALWSEWKGERDKESEKSVMREGAHVLEKVYVCLVMIDVCEKREEKYSRQVIDEVGRELKEYAYEKYVANEKGRREADEGGVMRDMDMMADVLSYIKFARLIDKNPTSLHRMVARSMESVVLAMIKNENRRFDFIYQSPKMNKALINIIINTCNAQNNVADPPSKKMIEYLIETLKQDKGPSHLDIKIGMLTTTITAVTKGAHFTLNKAWIEDIDRILSSHDYNKGIDPSLPLLKLMRNLEGFELVGRKLEKFLEDRDPNLKSFDAMGAFTYLYLAAHSYLHNKKIMKNIIVSLNECGRDICKKIQMREGKGKRGWDAVSLHLIYIVHAMLKLPELVSLGECTSRLFSTVDRWVKENEVKRVSNNNTTETKLQGKTKEVLDAMKISYREEIYVSGFNVDFLLDDGVVIEVVGPPHYTSDGLLNRSTKIRQKIIENLGYRIVYISNEELGGSIESKICKMRLILSGQRTITKRLRPAINALTDSSEVIESLGDFDVRGRQEIPDKETEGEEELRDEDWESLMGIVKLDAKI